MDADVIRLLDSAAPIGGAYFLRPPLADDEAEWFLQAVRSNLVSFGECQGRCPRLQRWHAVSHDEFTTPDGQLRHLFSFPPERPRLNREYIPHIAGWAKAIIGAGYDPKQASFSRYRSFARDMITKREGTRYETDGEFYAADGSIWLHLEAKRDSRQVDAIAIQLDRAGELRELPRETAKEIEYVLELRPRHLWVIGPGSIDPPRHVFRVFVDGLSARFERVSDLPSPPYEGVDVGQAS